LLSDNVPWNPENMRNVLRNVSTLTTLACERLKRGSLGDPTHPGLRIAASLTQGIEAFYLSAPEIRSWGISWEPDTPRQIADWPDVLEIPEDTRDDRFLNQYLKIYVVTEIDQLRLLKNLRLADCAIYIENFH